MKRLVVLFMILGLVLAACGSGDGTDETAQATEQATRSSRLRCPKPPRQGCSPPTRRYPLRPHPPPSRPTPHRPQTSPEPTNTPAAEEQPTEAPTPAPTVPEAPQVTDIMVEIPAGPFIMGQDDGGREDRPAHEVDLPAYEIDKFEVTNADFAAFVAGHRLRERRGKDRQKVLA